MLPELATQLRLWHSVFSSWTPRIHGSYLDIQPSRGCWKLEVEEAKRGRGCVAGKVCGWKVAIRAHDERIVGACLLESAERIEFHEEMKWHCWEKEAENSAGLYILYSPFGDVCSCLWWQWERKKGRFWFLHFFLQDVDMGKGGMSTLIQGSYFLLLRTRSHLPFFFPRLFMWLRIWEGQLTGRLVGNTFESLSERVVGILCQLGHLWG